MKLTLLFLLPVLLPVSAFFAPPSLAGSLAEGLALGPWCNQAQEADGLHWRRTVFTAQPNSVILDDSINSEPPIHFNGHWALEQDPKLQITWDGQQPFEMMAMYSSTGETLTLVVFGQTYVYTPCP